MHGFPSFLVVCVEYRLHLTLRRCVLALQLLDRRPGQRHVPACSPALLGPKPAGQHPHQRQQGPQLPPAFNRQLPVATVQSHLPTDLWPTEWSGDQHRAVPGVHGRWCDEDRHAAGNADQGWRMAAELVHVLLSLWWQILWEINFVPGSREPGLVPH